jgi:hypothetical protein
VAEVPDLNDRTPRDGTSAHAFGCSRDGARLSMVFTQDDPSLADLQDTITQLIGGTSTDVFGGKIDRQLPMASGMFPMWSVNAITNAAGKGSYEKEGSRAPLGPPVNPEVARYEQYHWSVEFTSKPYPILDNDKIRVLSSDPDTGDPISWFNEAGVSKNFTYAEEWKRYTTFESLPRPGNWATGTIGSQNTFYTGSGAAPNNIMFPGTPRMRMPDSTLRVTLRAIPYRWVESENSYFERFLGYVNQRQFKQYRAGYLAFESYGSNVYCPPLQQKETLDGAEAVVRLCDVEMIFGVTRRRATDPPDTTAVGWNKNWVVDGWNALPWFGPNAAARRFYYSAHKDADITKRCPQNPSFPVEILFTDPDFPQIAGTFDP